MREEANDRRMKAVNELSTRENESEGGGELANKKYINGRRTKRASQIFWREGQDQN